MEDRRAYERIARKIDAQDPHGAPKGPDGGIHAAFLDHLAVTYSPEEAEIVQHLDSLNAFKSAGQVAEASGREPAYVQHVLAALGARGAVVAAGDLYCLPPIPLLINLHHFRPDTRPGDLEAARLYEAYFVASGFFRKYETVRKGIPVGRVIPIDRSIEATEQVLEAEEAHDYIWNHSDETLALVPCPCRTRTEKLGVRQCRDKFPIGACIMMGAAALMFEQTGLGKRVTKEQAVAYFDEMLETGLVGHTLNVQAGDRLICLCCGCCCSQLRGRTRWGNPDALAPSNFVPRPGDGCVGCGTCTERCVLGALTLDEETGEPRVDPDTCLGCGLCALACPQETLKLRRLERASIAFATSEELDAAMHRENHEAG